MKTNARLDVHPSESRDTLDSVEKQLAFLRATLSNCGLPGGEGVDRNDIPGLVLILARLQADVLSVLGESPRPATNRTAVAAAADAARCTADQSSSGGPPRVEQAEDAA